MRKICLVVGVLLLPLPATAQHSWSLPAIGLPPPAPPPKIPVVQSEWRQRTPWDRMQPPAWERRERPTRERQPIDKPRDGDRLDSRHRGARGVIYVPYAVYSEPHVIVVQQPPVTRIVEVPVPAPEPRVEEPPPAEGPPPPPYVPTGDRTVYVIPGCYVGNVSPVNLKLADHCDITKLTTYVP
jgi:hypothetical protein